MGDLDTCAVKAFDIKTGQPRHFGSDGITQLRPVKARLLHIPAECTRVRDIVGKTAGIDIQLLWHAATDHTGSANAVLLGDHHTGAMTSRHPGRTDAARACTDDEQINFAHGAGPSRQS